MKKSEVHEENITFPTQAVEEEDKMTPEQLAIKNVGKQVTFYVNLFTMRHAIVMSLNFFSRATIV